MKEIVPNEVLLLGEVACARYILRATPLGAFARDGKVRRLIAEEKVFSEVSPWIHVVSAMEGEDELVATWAKLRPHIHDPLRAKTETDLLPFAPYESAGAKLRLLVRLAAYRRLDAAYCGKQSFGRTAELGTDTYFYVRAPAVSNPIKIGTVISAIYEGDPKRDKELLDLCGDSGNVSPIEHAISGCFPKEDAPTAWDEAARIIAEVAPLREWERASKISNLPSGWWFDLLAIPAGVSIRPAAAEIFKEVGHEGGLVLLNRLGLSPFCSTAAASFLMARAGQVAALSEIGSIVEDFFARSALVMDLVHGARKAS